MAPVECVPHRDVFIIYYVPLARVAIAYTYGLTEHPIVVRSQNALTSIYFYIRFPKKKTIETV